ncbi:hypothetical protein GeomeDRAFT_1389 [Geobacter metallireducens RCH3]|uniref:hypothetical protein n=1 Tax=Geobacter metallireducens TaxID=28232 RepID=UPI0000386EBA|nr:hypothetical protein [Geobacter metallireducens]EHP87303.1 hypothetical protein GeomeDRAFT_1389 [Geobacter metallireducens RCH3]
MGEEASRCRCGQGKPGEKCPHCGKDEETWYWCEVCEEAVASSRCPICGLKTRRMRG